MIAVRATIFLLRPSISTQHDSLQQPLPLVEPSCLRFCGSSNLTRGYGNVMILTWEWITLTETGNVDALWCYYVLLRSVATATLLLIDDLDSSIGRCWADS